MHFDMQHYQWRWGFHSPEHEKAFAKLKSQIAKVKNPEADAEDGTPGSLNRLLLKGRNGKAFRTICDEHDSVSRMSKEIRQDKWHSR
jgi:hypothetical protein